MRSAAEGGFLVVRLPQLVHSSHHPRLSLLLLPSGLLRCCCRLCLPAPRLHTLLPGPKAAAAGRSLLPQPAAAALLLLLLLPPQKLSSAALSAIDIIEATQASTRRGRGKTTRTRRRAASAWP